MLSATAVYELVFGFLVHHPLFIAYIVIMSIVTLYRRSKPFPETGGNVVTITSLAEWKNEVDAHGGPVLADFYATWCPPCKTAAPIFGRMSLEYPSVKFVKVNVDEVGEVSSAQKITAMPTFKLFSKNPVETIQVIAVLVACVAGRSVPSSRIACTWFPFIGGRELKSFLVCSFVCFSFAQPPRLELRV
jgi:thioredoxin 1